MSALRAAMGTRVIAAILCCAAAGCGSPADDPAGQDEAATLAPASAAAPATTAAESKPAAWGQCAACHAVAPGKHGVGPSLAGVLGRKAGTQAGFAYSAAMAGSALVWDEATLDRYLAAPAKTLPGTKMSYAGLSDGEKRKELIEYLKTLK